MTLLRRTKAALWLAAPVAAVLSLGGATLAHARTIYVTPEGEPGYEGGSATPIPAQRYADSAFADLRPGDDSTAARDER